MQRTTYIIVNTATGKPVQSWTFAGKKHIMYCTTPEWAMPNPDEDSANRRLKFLQENFHENRLSVMKVTFKTNVIFG